MIDDRRSLEGRPLVLVVENEPTLRMTAVDMVEDAGYRAIEAATSQDAIRHLETNRDIRIVFTDMDMRGADGVTLAVAIRDRWPPVEMILTSSGPIAKAKLPDRGVFLSRPFSRRQFETALACFADTARRDPD